MNKSYKIIKLLVGKSAKTLVRQKSVYLLAAVSSVLVCGSLYLMWLFSVGQTVNFMTSSAYSKLSFDLGCEPRDSLHPKVVCKPIDPPPDPSTPLSSTDFLLSVLQDGSSVIADSQETRDIAGLLSSIMMNGLPLLGLDDFVYLSDFVNDNIGARARDQLLRYPGYRDKFGNFLNIRKNQLRVTPRSYWSNQFVSYLGNSSATFRGLNVAVFDSPEAAMVDCCDRVWAILDISPSPKPSGSVLSNILQTLNLTDDTLLPVRDPQQATVPAVTIRMHPASIPDTRNFEWSPLQRSAPTRQQSGQLLYFLSGFLSLQIEIQNFLTSLAVGDAVRIETDVFKKQAGLLLQPSQVAAHIADALFAARNRSDVSAAMLNSTSRQEGERPSLFFPLYHRAFPTHDYKQSMYWHVFGTLVTITLIMYFSLPAALAAGAYRRELANGLLDILSTYPGVKHFHSVMAWCLCCGLWVVGLFGVSLLFFSAVLHETSAVIPATCLLLFGCALGPFAMVLGEIIQSADAVVVAVPSIVFISLLPGLLYFDLAFDVQRAFWLEMAMSLLPASAVALALRLTFATESIFVRATWRSAASISQTPLYCYALMLAFDVLLYTLLAYVMVWKHGSNSLYADRNATSNNNRLGAQQPVLSRQNSGDCPVDSQQSSPLSFQYSSFRVSSSGNNSPIGAFQNRKKSVSQRMYSCCCCSCINCSLFCSAVYQMCCDVVQWARGQHAYSVIPATSSHENLSPREKFDPVRDALNVQFEDEDEESPESSAQKPVPPSSVALAIKYLTKQRTSGSIGVVVLANISTVLRKDCVTLLLGSNGAGKTTLMKILSGIDSEYTGDIQVASSGAHRDGQFAAKKNRRAVGWCPQNDALFAYLTVQEHLQLFTDLLNVSSPSAHARNLSGKQQERAAKAQVAEALNKLSMTEHRLKLSKALSGGMKRRLSLALAFIGNPSVLLLDEPTSGCDSYTRELVRKDVLSHKGPDCAVLLSTHHTDDIDVLADHVWFLNDRFLEFDDSIDQLSAPQLLATRRKRLRAGSASCQSFTDLNVCEPLSARSTSSRRQSRRSPKSLGAAAAPPPAPDSHLNSNLEFTTWDEEVRERLTHHFGKALLDGWLDVASSRCETNPPGVASPSLSDEFTKGPAPSTNVYVWVVEPVHHAKLLQFVEQLEAAGNLNWSLHSSYAYKALCQLYDQDDEEPRTTNTVDSSADLQTVSPPSNSLFDSPQLSTRDKAIAGSETPSRASSFAEKPPAGRAPLTAMDKLRWHVYSIMWMRYLEIRASLSIFLVTQLLIPFLVVLAVTCSCRDVTYPKAELTSSSIRGMGEIPVSQGVDPDPVGGVGLGLKSGPGRHGRVVSEPLRSLASDTYGVSHGPHGKGNTAAAVNTSTTALYRSLVSHMANQSATAAEMVWVGEMNSDEMYAELYASYYRHAEQRWGGVVLQDTVPQWVESTVVISQEAMAVDVVEAFAEIQKAQQKICAPNSAPATTNSTSAYNATLSTSFSRQLQSTTRDLVPGDTASETDSKHTKTTDKPDTSSSSQQSAICGDFPSTTITLRNETVSANSSDGSAAGRTRQQYSIAITSFESLHSNLTMMTNVTTDHAAPVFLKEVVPAIYSALSRSVGHTAGSSNAGKRSLLEDVASTSPSREQRQQLQQRQQHQQSAGSSYVLYSHPLPEVNYTNEVYIERGYLGSTIIMLYLLIVTISAVRFVTKTRSSGMKTQLHIAGVSSLAYWLSNYLFDAAVIGITLLSAYLAVFLGGDPIKNYFFPFAPANGVVFLGAIVAFACSITACSYAFTVLSRDQLSSQLFMLISTIITGGFLKLYLDRSSNYEAASTVLVLISPSFAFSSLLLDLFKIYAYQVAKNLTGIDHTARSANLYHHVHHCLRVMCVQSVVYLALCVLVDAYIVQFWACVKEWHWYYSAVVLLEKSTGLNLGGGGGSGSREDSTDQLASIDRPAESITRSRNNHSIDHDDHVEMLPSIGGHWSFNTPLKSNTPVHSRYSSTDTLGSPSLESVDLMASEQRRYRDSLRTPNTAFSSESLASGGRGLLNLIGKHRNDPLSENCREDHIGIFPVVDSKQYRHALQLVQQGVAVGSVPAQITTDQQEQRAARDSAAISSQGVCVEYPKRSKLALCNLTFRIPAGSRVALMGMNGGGKSTLFKTLALAENIPLAGALSIFGRDVVRNRWDIGTSNLLGYVPQEGGLLEFLTVAESIELFTMIKLCRGVADCGAEPDGDASIIPDKYRHYPIYSLSGGTKKKLLIRTVNIAAPALLLLDECTTGVDPIAADRIMRYLKENIAREQKKKQESGEKQQSLLFSSHRIDESLAVCDRVLMLVDGQTYLDGGMEAFHDLAYQFYQVDVTLNPAYNMHSQNLLFSLAMRSDSYIPLNMSLVDFFVLHVENACKSFLEAKTASAAAARAQGSRKARRIERVVAYSSSLVRLTFEKRLVPISALYAQMGVWRQQGLVVKFTLRNMDLEEVLSTIIATAAATESEDNEQ